MHCTEKIVIYRSKFIICEHILCQSFSQILDTNERLKVIYTIFAYRKIFPIYSHNRFSHNTLNHTKSSVVKLHIKVQIPNLTRMGRMSIEYAYQWAWSENSRITCTIAFLTIASNDKLFTCGLFKIKHISTRQVFKI